MSSLAVVAAETASVREVARLMLDHVVGGVPVIDASGAAIGMASDGDLWAGGSTKVVGTGGSRCSSTALRRRTSSAPAAIAPSAKSCRRH
jgi:CBS-domain-containing membrane protein